MSSDPRIQLVVFDWAGTTVDHGCFAPVAAFIEAFARQGVTITIEQARAPMGLHKKDHVRAIAQTPEVSTAWRDVHGRDWTEADIEVIFSRHFVPLQLEAAAQHSQLLPGLPDCLAALRKNGIKIGTSTGYFREAAERVYASARGQGYVADFNVCADDVPAGRPAPWMIFRNMEALGVFPPSQVVKVGDTVPDIQEGRNAGVWSVGVTHTGSEVGRTLEEFAELSPSARDTLVAAAAEKLRGAGAHDIIDSIASLPDLLPVIQRRLADGQKP